MSIGNLKDQGNKGNNFPYQLKNLQLLGLISDNLSGLATETTLASVDTKLTAASRTPNILTVVNTTGSTPAAVYSFSIANVGTADGTVDGQGIPPGVTINFDGGSLNNTLSSLPYDATGTVFIITWIS